MPDFCGLNFVDRGTLSEGEGTSPNIAQALIWYKKMAIEGKEYENDINPITAYGKREVYRLVCLKKVTPQQATPPYTPADYQYLFGRGSNEKCELSLVRNFFKYNVQRI